MYKIKDPNIVCGDKIGRPDKHWKNECQPPCFALLLLIVYMHLNHWSEN